MLAFTDLVIIALLVTCALAWRSALQRFRRKGSLLRPKRHPDPPWGLADLLLTFLVLAICQSVGDVWVRGIYRLPPERTVIAMDPEPRSWILFLAALATLIALAASVGWIHFFRGGTLRDLGMRFRRPRNDVWLGAVAFVMLAPVIYGLQWILVQWVESKHPLVELLKENPDPWSLLLTTFAAVLVAPIAEEFFFRVLLQGWFERLARGEVNLVSFLVGRVDADGVFPLFPFGSRDAGTMDAGTMDAGTMDAGTSHGKVSASPLPERPVRRWWPILLSSGMFALAHWSHGPDPIPLFILAVVLGYVYQRTRRILPCIVIHFLLNACSLIALWAEVYRA